MPNLLNKSRIKQTTQTENEALGALTLGETLPSEYIPAIDLSNYIDANNIAGDANKTGITNSFTDTTLEKAIGNAKIKTKHLQNNTNIASDLNKIDSSLIHLNENSELGVLIPESENYLLKNTVDKTELNLLSERIPEVYYFGINEFASLGTFIPADNNSANDINDTNNIEINYASNTRLVIASFEINLKSKKHRIINIDTSIFYQLLSGADSFSLVVSSTPITIENYIIPQNVANIEVINSYKINTITTTGETNYYLNLSFVHDLRLKSNAQLRSTYYYYLVYQSDSMCNIYRYNTKILATSYYKDSLLLTA